ncbi:helix-turn-helix transcriptional regulator [Falsiroseomonas sp. HW251]|uniref:helix-turn-helix transcriptional regulator n=1 Tax=Falsiroseomonas sp. HW251 TaxID=3390998 RepID=UPI003D316B5F
MSQILKEVEAAACLGLSRRTLKRLRDAGIGPRFIRLSARRLGYDLSELDAWKAGRTFNSRAAELAARSPGHRG